MLPIIPKEQAKLETKTLFGNLIRSAAKLKHLISSKSRLQFPTKSLNRPAKTQYIPTIEKLISVDGGRLVRQPSMLLEPDWQHTEFQLCAENGRKHLANHPTRNLSTSEQNHTFQSISQASKQHFTHPYKNNQTRSNSEKIISGFMRWENVRGCLVP